MPASKASALGMATRRRCSAARLAIRPDQVGKGGGVGRVREQTPSDKRRRLWPAHLHRSHVRPGRALQPPERVAKPAVNSAAWVKHRERRATVWARCVRWAGRARTSASASGRTAPPPPGGRSAGSAACLWRGRGAGRRRRKGSRAQSCLGWPAGCATASLAATGDPGRGPRPLPAQRTQGRVAGVVHLLLQLQNYTYTFLCIRTGRQ